MSMDHNDFERIVADLGRCIDIRATFPQQVFQGAPGFRVIEWDLLWSRDFFWFARDLALVAGSSHLSLMVLKPHPESYFLRNFGTLPYAIFSTADHADKYIRIVNEDPGESPADAIIHNSDVVAIWPASQSWCLYGVREFEIAVIGAYEKPIVDAIDSHQLASYLMAQALEKRIVSLGSGGEAHDFRKQLLRNYGFVA